MKQGIKLVGLLAAGALALSACGTTASTPTSSAPADGSEAPSSQAIETVAFEPGGVAGVGAQPEFGLGMRCGAGPSGEFGNGGVGTPCVGAQAPGVLT